MPTESEAKEKVKSALDRLYEADASLMKLDVNERSVTHRLAGYLQDLCPDWHVDCEYNRLGEDVKRLNLKAVVGEQTETDATEAVTVYPDIIVHKRGTDENLLVIEVKKAGSADGLKDKMKLCAFLSDDSFNYRYGAFVRLDNEDAVEWFTPKNSSAECRAVREAYEKVNRSTA